jgi:hypothetical protein
MQKKLRVNCFAAAIFTSLESGPRNHESLSFQQALSTPQPSKFINAGSTDASERTGGITLIQTLLVRTRPPFATIWLLFVDVVQLRAFCRWRLLRP